MKSRIVLICCGVLLICCASIWYLRLWPVPRTIWVKPLYMKGIRVFSHDWPMPRSRYWTIPGDGMDDNNRSTLALFEDGKELGPAHSIHLDVARKGRGRFSHWGEKLIFSASDNTDPRYNRRRYTIRVRPIPTDRLLYSSLAGGAAALVLGGAIIFRRRKGPGPRET